MSATDIHDYQAISETLQHYLDGAETRVPCRRDLGLMWRQRGGQGRGNLVSGSGSDFTDIRSTQASGRRMISMKKLITK